MMEIDRNERPPVFAERPEDRERALLLAEKLGSRIVHEKEETEGVCLSLGEEGLSLVGGGMSVRGDFTRMLPRIRKNRIYTELLVKAAKPGSFGAHPTAVDATAGLGEDSVLLAAAGFRVIMFEYDPVIAALLADALTRAERIPELKEIVLRMELREGDSIEAMKRLEVSPDVILLDPMFPERTKSALVKKKFQLLHMLEAPCSSEEELLAAAKAAGPGKIIVKRPVKGPYLAGVRPDYSIGGKAVRYDCLVG